MMLFALVLQVAASTVSPSGPVPRAPLPSLVGPDDYPAAARRYDQSGTVRFRLDVAPDGRVQDCTILGSSGYSPLDVTTCRLMTSRARFAPARDASGQPIAGTYEASIAWRLGPAAPPRLNTATLLWISCVSGESAKRAVSQQDPTAVTAASVAACNSLEPLLLAELARAKLPGMAPAAAFELLKLQTGTRLAEQLRAVRATLEIGAPVK